MATVTDPFSGCTASVNVEVTENTNPPLAVANAPTQLGCGQNEVALDGTGSSNGPQFNYLWTVLTGNITSGETTLFPSVDAPGIYVLTVTDLQNGCEASAQVELLPGGN